MIQQENLPEPFRDLFNQFDQGSIRNSRTRRSAPVRASSSIRAD